MAQTSYTPISLYYSTTASATPTAGNLVNGELAINITDGKIFYKDNAGVVQVIGTKGGVGSSTNTQVLYNSSGLVVGSANMTFDGTNLTVLGSISTTIASKTAQFNSAGGSIYSSYADGTKTWRTGAGIQTAGVYSIYNSTDAVTAINITAAGQVQATYDALISGLTVGKGTGAVSSNTIIGAGALLANSSGTNLIGVGSNTLAANTSGARDVAMGFNALVANTTGSDNSAVGNGALGSNTTGSSNTAYGSSALLFNTTASNNTAVGYQAGYSTTTNQSSAYFGYQSGYSANGNANSFFGNNSGSAVTSGQKNTIIGTFSGNNAGLDIRTASNYIVLSDGDGNPRGWFDASGFFFNPAAYANTTGNAANLYVTSTGYFLRSTSALKYKKDVRDLESIDINKIRPVRYKSKSEQDDQTKDHFGVIADEVHDAGITELVTYGIDGEVEGFQYERLTVVLLKTIQDLQKRIETLEKK